MTPYFKSMFNFDENTPLPDGFPWASWAEFTKEAEQVWEQMKADGVTLGKLEVMPDGSLKGFGHPDDWFDAVTKDDPGTV